jgi:hypothetical protein
MSLPENMNVNLEKALTQNGILEASLAKEATSDLEAGKPIKWNLMLTKQLGLEKGEAREVDD